MKRYDRAYFDRWYRGRHRVNAPADVRGKVAMAIAVAEFFLHRPIQNALDVGCGEGAWYTHLRDLRPRATYVGVDPSEYVVERFGRERNIRQAAFGEIESLHLRMQFDLVICADVMHYVPDAELRRGIPVLASLGRGAFYFEALTREDEIVGDLHDFIRRPAAWYRRHFRNAGLVAVAPYTWAAAEVASDLAALEEPR